MSKTEVRSAMPMKKEFKNGNVLKAKSYAAAWHQIDKAINAGFFIEAISIQESIISDRLFHHLHEHLELPLRNSRNQHHSLSDLIRYAQNKSGHAKGTDNIFFRISGWRKNRNDAVHALVRSDPGMPTKPANEFFACAENAALEGARCARDIDNWCKREKTTIKRLNRGKNNPLDTRLSGDGRH